MSRWGVVVGMVIGVACGHHEPPPRTSNEAAPASAGKRAPTNGEMPAPANGGTAAVADEDPAPCDAVARHAIANSRTDHSNDKDLIAMLRGRCIADGWSVAARTCYLLAANWDEALLCEPKLTPYQVKSLEAEIEARGSVMGHPPPGD